MSSSSYTASPRPQLPGLWAAELAGHHRGATHRGVHEPGSACARAPRHLRTWPACSWGSCPASPSAAAGLAVPPAITLQSLRRRHSSSATDKGPAFPRSFRPSNRKGSAGSPLSPCSAFTKLEPTFFGPRFCGFCTVIRIFAIWSCGCVIPGLVNGTGGASATRAPCEQSPERHPYVLRGQKKSKILLRPRTPRTEQRIRAIIRGRPGRPRPLLFCRKRAVLKHRRRC